MKFYNLIILIFLLNRGLLVLWCFASKRKIIFFISCLIIISNLILFFFFFNLEIPSIITLSESNGIKSCSQSSYKYPLPPRLLHQCYTYLVSLLLAYILVLSIII